MAQPEAPIKTNVKVVPTKTKRHPSAAIAAPRLHGRMEGDLDGKSTGSLVSTRIETVDDGKGRKYYRTAPRPTTEVLDSWDAFLAKPAVAVAMLGLSYNASTRIVMCTTSRPRFSARAVTTIYQSSTGSGHPTRRNQSFYSGSA